LPLEVGTRLGPYEILSPIGAGGMGEVWKARDTRLDRLVAIKSIHGPFSERFEREARAISALNHPHICALYDVGEHDGAGYLVMEFVEGAPLKGPLPLDQGVKYAAQICDALDAAHRKAIVHRDLKPDNILLTKAGVKLLDFGLAKAVSPAEAGSHVSPDAAATKALTGAHVILGTPQYMAPEQIEGRDADTRTDLFAFGCVLYELITGQKAFEGKTPSSVMAAILATEPRPLRELQPVTPAALERIVKRCLAKDPDERWQSARDLKAELEWVGAGANATAEPVAKRRPMWSMLFLLAAGAVVALIAALAVWSSWSSRAPDAPVLVAEINAPQDVTFTNRVMVSPDGRALVAQARVAGVGLTQLMIRPLDSVTWRALPGTEDAFGPSWSPDSKSLVFVTGGGKVRRIAVAGGPAETLCDSPPGFIPFTSWNRDGVILFSGRDGLRRVSAAGGASTQVTALDAAAHESLHGVPQFLPDGRHFLYWVRSSEPERNGVMVGSLDAAPGVTNRKLIQTGPAAALFARAPASSGGFLLFMRESALMARPFDVAALAPFGDAFQVLPQVGRATDLVNISASDNGVLAYSTDTNQLVRQLSWFDRAGKQLGDIGDATSYFEQSLSPDDTRVAIARRDRDNDDIWVLNLTPSGGLTRLTLHPGQDRFPVWSPDGRRIVYRAARESGEDLYEKPVSSVGAERLFLKLPPGRVMPLDWSPDGRHLAIVVDSRISIVTDGKAEPFTKTAFPESQAQFSPDGRWIAYTSLEARRADVFVQSFPAGGAKGLISIDGGSQPRWRRDGTELFYLSNDMAVMAVPIKVVNGAFEAGTAVRLFQTRISGSNTVSFQYSVTRDGQRFLVTSQAQGVGRPVTLITDWLATVKK
jgi:Tol biopolymer transport system component